jgi:hypothetical protein
MDEEDLIPEELTEDELEEAVEPVDYWNEMFRGEYTSGTMQRMMTDRQAGKVRRSK